MNLDLFGNPLPAEKKVESTYAKPVPTAPNISSGNTKEALTERPYRIIKADKHSAWLLHTDL